MRSQLLPIAILLSVACPLVSATIAPIFGGLNITITGTPINVTQTLDTPFPYNFPNQNDAETPALFSMPPCNGITLEEATIDQLQDYMSQGLLTSVQLALCYLQRHWQTDDYIK
jgi:amidase